jgi:hypothetical protein
MNKMNIWLSSIHTNNLRKTVGFRIELGKNLISKQPNGQGIIELRDPGVSMYWNKTKKIYNNFMTVQGPLYMNPDIFGSELFAEDFEKIEKLMLDDTELTRNTKQYMLGIKSQIAMSQPNAKQINLLKIFLENNDSRRNSDYKILFPWLVEQFTKAGLASS